MKRTLPALLIAALAASLGIAQDPIEAQGASEGFVPKPARVDCSTERAPTGAPAKSVDCAPRPGVSLSARRDAPEPDAAKRSEEECVAAGDAPSGYSEAALEAFIATALKNPCDHDARQSTHPPEGGLDALAKLSDPGDRRARVGAVRGFPPIGTRMFAPAILDLPAGFSAVGVLAFPRPPANDIERRRALAICKAFITVLPDSAAASAQAPGRAQMVTLWPMTTRTDPQAIDRGLLDGIPERLRTAICARAVLSYGYIAADGWLAQLPRSARLDPAARGPVLIAWAPPASRGDPRAPVLIYDLSAYEQPATLVQAFSIWKKEIEDRPALWGNGWDLTRWRLEAAARLDRYGSGVLAALKLVPFLGGG